MRVDVDQTWPDEAAREIEARLRPFPRFRGHNRRDQPVAQEHVDDHQRVGGDRLAGWPLTQKGSGDGPAAETMGAPLGFLVVVLLLPRPRARRGATATF